MSLDFQTVRTCAVEVQYLRGQNDGRVGFWITTTCHQEKLSGVRFMQGGKIPCDLDRVRGNVLCYSDEDSLGITGKDCPVRTVGRDEDSALFIVTAKVQRPVRHGGDQA